MNAHVPKPNNEDKVDEKVDFVFAWCGMAMLLFAVVCTFVFGGCRSNGTGDPIVSPNHTPTADVPAVPAQSEPHVPYVPWWVKEK